MRRTITFINTTADRASARSIARVNEFNDNPRQLCFVFDKGTQLSECPRVVLSPLAMPNRDSVTDAAQIFQSNTPASVFSLGNNTLANRVIDIGSKTSLFARTFYEKSFGCLRVFYLKFATKFRLTLSETVDLIARVSLTIGISGNIHDAEVNPQVTVRVIGSRFRSIYHDSDVEDTITENQIRLSYLTVNSGFLVSTNSCGDNPSATQGQNRNLVQSLPRKDTLVVNHSRMDIERMLDIPVNLVALRDLGNRSYRHLSREFVMLTKVAVNQMVKMELPIGKSFKSLPRSVVTGFVEAFHCFKQSLVLLLAWGKFYHQGLLHANSVEHIFLYVKYIVEEGRIPLSPEGGSLLRQRL